MEWMLIYNNYDDECPDFENILEVSLAYREVGLMSKL